MGYKCIFCKTLTLICMCIKHLAKLIKINWQESLYIAFNGCVSCNQFTIEYRHETINQIGLKMYNIVKPLDA